MNSNQSEVARIEEQMQKEYEACQQVFTGFTPTAKHEYVTKRQENLGMCFEELKKHMSPEDAMQIFIQMEKKENGNPENWQSPGELIEC